MCNLYHVWVNSKYEGSLGYSYLGIAIISHDITHQSLYETNFAVIDLQPYYSTLNNILSNISWNY
jgi:hypothetical protein